ncbi:MAG: Rieske 2Fe-2S domain-containing protein [Candidatus Omnitrophica bacterium]|nr:Rieske 2Fe-2S domain-containing protein [Candidatus Omnitrophota bacterium]
MENKIMTNVETTPPKISRRNFLGKFGIYSFLAYLGGSALATIRFMFPNVLYEPSTTFRAGLPDEYSVGSVSTRWMKEHRVWIVRSNKGLYALFGKCTHLGCTPNWFEAEKRFKCPCHGSNFDVEGNVIAGPAPKPLFRAQVSLSDDGQILVDKGRLENNTDKREGKNFLLSV